MPKKGMKRPARTHTQPRNQQEPVPELQGKAKHTKEKAPPVIISGVDGMNPRIYLPERPIPADVYPVVDTDLARDNLENDISAADLTEL